MVCNNTFSNTLEECGIILKDTIHFKIHGKITSKYGYREHPIFKTIKFHSGIDLQSKIGDPIYALEDGYIIFVGYKNGYGNVIIVEHLNTVKIMYAHLSTIKIKLHDQVYKNDILGTVGNSGLTTGAHLHIEVYIKNVRVDPEIFVVDDKM